MSFLDFALRMGPYWLLGLFTFISIWKSSYKDILSFDKKAFAKFFGFMLTISLIRYVLLSAMIKTGIGAAQLQAVTFLPLGGTLFTPWEDLCHSVPLVLLRRMIGTSKWMMPIHYLLTLLIMVSFGSGHLYQGILPAMFISLYIPFSVKFIQKRGAGTLMAGHVLYDFMTLGLVKLLMHLYG